MWPPGHLAVGYLSYAVLRRFGDGDPPNATATVALAVGTQLPDVVDKPLSWTFGLLPTGRSLAHSALTTMVVTAVVARYANANDRPAVGAAFAVGYWSHLLGDLYAAVVAGESQTNWFFLWPIVPQEGYVTSPSFLEYVEAIGWRTALVIAYVGAFALAATIVSRRTREDGRPFSLFVTGVVATSALFVYEFGSPWIVLELVLVQVAVAVWIRDGAPGVPRRAVPSLRE